MADRCVICGKPALRDSFHCLACSEEQQRTGQVAATPSPSPAEPTDPAAACHSCGAPEVETGYGLPLCAPCRTKLARRPIPPFIIATALVVLLALVFAFASFPESLSAGIAYERGQRAEAAGNNAVAATDYRKVLQSYPNSIDAVIRYAVSSYHAGQYRQAGSALDKLSGQEVSKDQADEIDPIAQALERKTAAPPSP